MDVGSFSGIADAAVSPVIGMVLVLAISLLGIASVITWGMPVLAELRAGTELLSALDQFRDFDGAIRQLVAGAAGQTTVRWEPHVERGTVSVDSKGDRWVVSVTTAAPGGPGFRFASLSDDDGTFAAVNVGSSVGSAYVRAWSLAAGASYELLTFRGITCSGTSGRVALSWASGSALNFTICTNETSPRPFDLPASVVQVSFFDSTKATTIETMWIANVGKVTFQETAGATPRHIFSSNGGLFSGPGNDVSIQNDNPFPPPTNYTNATGQTATSMFVRLLRINGSASVAPSGTGGGSAIFASLASTQRLAAFSNATNVTIYDFGILHDPWFRVLTDASSGYRFARSTTTIFGEPVESVVHTEGVVPFRVTIVDSQIEVVQ